jgi:formamidase
MDKEGSDKKWDKIAGEAARTVPGRENGGNCDIKVCLYPLLHFL